MSENKNWMLLSAKKVTNAILINNLPRSLSWRPEGKHYSYCHSREQGSTFHEDLYDTLRCLISPEHWTSFAEPTHEKICVSRTGDGLAGSPQTPGNQNLQWIKLNQGSA